MVSAAKAMQEEHGDTGSGRPQPLDNKVLSDTVKGSAISDQLNPEDEITPKVRKPYTITKQRERWTEEEHKKFLEALKLYGRAWRKIEEHVGSKTAVQIRSHAQKFFSKITRGTDAGEESTLKPIEIPPPRPKRKPAHPYPRKMATLTKPGNSSPEKLTRSLSANMSVSDHENQSSSPTSVLSAIGSDNSPNGSLSPVSSNIGVKHGGNKSLDDAENSSEDEQVLDLLPHNKDESNGQFLKLFGKTLLVADQNPETCKPELSYKSESDNKNISSPTRVVARKLSTTNSFECVSPDLPWLTLHSGVTLSAQEILSPKPIKAHLACDKIGKIDDGKLNENSSDSSNEEKSRVVESCLEFKGQVKNLISSYKLSKRIAADSLKGFVPYKRCVMDRDSAVSTTENSDEREEKRIRICS